jgi:hypothetical protein
MRFVPDEELLASIFYNARQVLQPKTYPFIKTTVDKTALYLKVSIIFSLSLAHYY